MSDLSTFLEPVKAKEITEIRGRSNALIMKATQISSAVKDVESYKKAISFRGEVRAFRKWWEDRNKPVKKALDEAKRAHLENVREIDFPLEKAEKDIINPSLLRFERIAEAERQKEQLRIQEQMRKEEEDRRLAHAVELEESGKKREAEKVLSKPVVPPPVVLDKVTGTGGENYADLWKFRVKDETAIPRKYMVPDLVAIGKVVRGLKDKAGIPGIEVYSERIVRGG